MLAKSPLVGAAGGGGALPCGGVHVARPRSLVQVAYSVLKGLWPTSTLQPGAKPQTSATLDKVSAMTIEVASPTQVLRRRQPPAAG